VVFEADYDEIELQKYSYDVISVPSPQHHKIFSNLSPSHSKFLATPVYRSSLLQLSQNLIRPFGFAFSSFLSSLSTPWHLTCLVGTSLALLN